jgi:glutamate-ammonia-ligase adenylyltransferase
LLGTGPRFARDLKRHPDLLRALASDELVEGRSREFLDRQVGTSSAWRSGPEAVATGLRRFALTETLRIAARDVLDLAQPDATGGALSDLAEAVVGGATRHVAPELPFAVIGMGRLGGRELAYESDLDLMFVYEPAPGVAEDQAARMGEAAATDLVRMIGGSTPASAVYRVDTNLRPEGRDGPQVRSLDSYITYYGRWAHVWERQALVKARFVAGDAVLGARFMTAVDRFVWNQPFGADQVVEVRRGKARVEKERVPAGEDPTFHLKLGPGSLSDIEWTVQLLQLQTGVPGPNTMSALEALIAAGTLAAYDAEILAGSYRFCERTRNRLQLVRGSAGDALPPPGPVLTTLARSLGLTGTGLRNEYRRHTRRSRQVVERLFYGRGPA